MNNFSTKSLLSSDKIWFFIVKTRSLFSTLIILSTFIFEAFYHYSRTTTVIIVLLYFSAGFVLVRLFDKGKLLLKWFRLLRDFFDVLFITYIILATNYTSNLWFLLYIFPIISTARFGGRRFVFILSLIVIAVNILVYFVQEPNLYSGLGELFIKCLFYFALGFSLENLSRTKRVEQEKFNTALKIVENYIINDLNPEQDKQMYQNILQLALSLTNSEMGHIRLVDVNAGTSEMVCSIGHPKDYNWALRPMDDSFSKIVISSKKQYYINSITDALIKNKLGYYFTLYKPIPRSAIFYPIIKADDVVAVIAIYSRHRYHYSKEDIKKLENFSSLVPIVQNIANVYNERKKPIEALKEIGNLLIYQEDLNSTLDRINKFTLENLSCEESAIFLVDTTLKGSLIKQSVICFPKTNDRFFSLERNYKIGTFAVGKCFETQEDVSSIMDERIHTQAIKSFEAYRRLLPSGKIEHFICVPISIGGIKIGVIRAINKRVSAESANLSKEGFSKQDIYLLKVIASQLAVTRLIKDYEKTRSYFEGLVQNSPDPIIVVNPLGKVSKFNAACEKIWGHKANNVIGTSVAKYYESFEHAKEIGDALKREFIISREAKIKDRRGKIIPISLSASLLYDSNGDILGSIGVFKDLREQKKNEIRNLESIRLATVGRLMVSLGHDIKTNISIALNFIRTIKIDPNNQVAQLRNITVKALEASVKKIQETFDAVEPRETKLKLVSLAELFLSSSFAKEKERFHLQAEENDYEFAADFNFKEELLVLIDMEQIIHVFLNLFSNSIDAIEEREYLENINNSDFTGRIKMSAHITPRQLIVDWEDNGCGIPDDKRSKIFHPFITTKKPEMVWVYSPLKALLKVTTER